MKKIAITLLLLITATHVYSQIDTTRKDFFPLHVGDIWQYRDEVNKLAIQRVVGDTIIAGKRYFLLIHSLRTSSGVTRVDSQMRVIFNGGGGIFRLGERDSTIWPVSYTFWGLPTPQPLVRYNGITTMSVFGTQRDVMQFDFGGTPAAPYDTLWGFGALLAKGIGVIQEQYYEGEYYTLQGAIIESVQYGTIVSVNEISTIIPQQITLYQNYPNPFNPRTKIRYEIPHGNYASLKVYNLLGQEIAILANNFHQAGNHVIGFDASHLNSGMYIYVLQTGETKLVKKMLLLK